VTCLISFEGGDGCGKSTQLKLTATWLRARGCVVLETRQPGATPLGLEIRRLLLSGEHQPVPECELLMFLADRVQHVKTVIQPALDAGQWVLCDRYSDSTLAYQLAARQLGESETLLSMLRFAEAGCTPVQTFWLDLPVSESLERLRMRQGLGGEYSRLDQESLDFHRRVQQAFQVIYQEHRSRMIRIDGDHAEQVVQDEIRQHLKVLMSHG